jgi:hypothetical protein
MVTYITANLASVNLIAVRIFSQAYIYCPYIKLLELTCKIWYYCYEFKEVKG